MSETTESPLFVTALSKGLAIVTAFRSDRPSMTMVDIAEVTGLNKSTVQRSIFTLESLGYVAKDADTKRFKLTPKSLDLGTGYLQTSELVGRSNPYLHELNRAVEESCNLLEPCEFDMLYVSRFPSHKQISIHVPVGRHLPMYCTSAGRAYLSALPYDEVDRILRASDRVAYTPATITDIDKLHQAIEQARIDGYALACEEIYPGDMNIAVPVVNGNGHPLGAINVGAPSSRWSVDDIRKELAPKILNTARSVSAASRGLRSTYG